MATTLPHHLYGNFRQYKEDTEWCVDWLLDSAEACGHNLDRYYPEGGDTSNNTNFYLKSADIRRLAEFISEQWPALQISQAFTRKLDSAIKARTHIAAWFDTCGDPESLERNARHKHFISVLVVVQAVFQPFVDQQGEIYAQRQRPATARAHRQAYVENEEDELAEQVKGVVLTEDSQPAKAEAADEEYEMLEEEVKRKITIEQQTEDDVQSIHAAVHCLLTDLHRLRASNKRIWLDLRDGKLQATVANLLTTAAISLAARLEREALPVQIEKEASSYETLMSAFYNGNLERSTEVEQVQMSDGSFVDPLEFILFSGWQLSQVFLGEVHTKIYNRRLAAMSSRPKKTERKRLIRSGLTEVPEIDRISSQLPAAARSTEDPGNQPSRHGTSSEGFSLNPDPGALHFEQATLATLRKAYGVSLDHGLGKALTESVHEDVLLTHYRAVFPQAHNTTIFTAFVGQLFTDISNVLGLTGSSKAFEQLELSASNAKLKILIHKGLTGRMLSDVLVQLADRLGSNDAFEEGKLRFQQGFHDLLMNSPLACGAYQFNVLSGLCWSSTFEVDSNYIVMCMLHFYNAVRQCGLLEAVWPDMEYLIATHSPEYLFFGDTPKAIEDCAKVYNRFFGMSANKNLPTTKTAASHSLTRRSFWEHSFSIARLCTALPDRLTKAGSGLHLNDLALVLDELELQGDKHRITIDRAGKLTNRHELKAYSKRSRRNIAPLDLLKRLRTQLELDVAHMGFDYLNMQHKCKSMLDTIKAEVEAAGVGVQSSEGLITDHGRMIG